MKNHAAIHAAGAGQQSAEPSGSSSAPPFVETERARARPRAGASAGLTFPRFFTEVGVDAFDEIEGEGRAAASGHERGVMAFEERVAEAPTLLSEQASNVVVA